jgi:hypothetical protein
VVAAEPARLSDRYGAKAAAFPVARLRALRASFLIVGAISLLAIFPASRLPKYVPGELPAEDIVSEAGPGEGEAGSPA